MSIQKYHTLSIFLLRKVTFVYINSTNSVLKVPIQSPKDKRQKLSMPCSSYKDSIISSMVHHHLHFKQKSAVLRNDVKGYHRKMFAAVAVCHIITHGS